MNESGNTAKEGEPTSIHAVGTIFENDEGKILILRRQRNSPEGGTLGLVGGTVVPGETNMRTALKKIKQEIGINAEPSDIELKDSFRWNRPDLDIAFDLYKSKIDIHGEIINLDIEGSSEYMWISPEDASKRDDLMEGLYDILRKVYKT